MSKIWSIQFFNTSGKKTMTKDLAFKFKVNIDTPMKILSLNADKVFLLEKINKVSTSFTRL